MKWLPTLLAMLPSTVICFQHSAQVHFKISNRAKECATAYDFCDIDELDRLADELEQSQACGVSKDTKKVYDILRHQGQLKRMMIEGVGDDKGRSEEEYAMFKDYLYYHW